MRKQRGVTMLGWVILLIPVAIVLYAGIRLTPPYLNYYKVVQALEQTATQFKNEDTVNTQQITNAISKRFDTGYVDKPAATDIKIEKNAQDVWQMSVDYEDIVPMFGNMYLLLQFQKKVPIK